MSNDAKEIRMLVCGLLLVFTVCFGGCYCGSNVQVSEGYRDSTIRKVSESGIVFKTWEVETLGDGLRVNTSDKGTSVSPETFAYSVTDAGVLAKVREIPIGKRVRISYRKRLAPWFPAGESRYFMTGVEVLTD